MMVITLLIVLPTNDTIGVTQYMVPQLAAAESVTVPLPTVMSLVT